jgi:predicted glycogen debranching enzyme
MEWLRSGKHQSLQDSNTPTPHGSGVDEGRGASATAFEQQLHHAASQFIVRRGEFKSVIAGYPWFLDWGRDTLICARGLIAGGWLEEVKQLLIVFGRFEQGGTLPNTIHGNDASNRDTSDAPLWYGVVAEELAAATDVNVFTLKVDASRTVLDVLCSIAAGYLKGTANGIRVDAASGLVWSPSHFTWMDTNYPAGTPREGFPIEIQSLWIRLLRLLARLNAPSSGEAWSAIADRAAASLEQLYWLEAKGWFADSLIAKAGVPAAKAVPDQVLRSNCLIPVSFGQLTGERAQRCVEAARRHLAVPGALRSLAPLPAEPPLPIHSHQGALLNNPTNPYWGRYEGDEDTRRKPAYHNGTAWTWTFPSFCEALVVAHAHEPAAVAAARAYLGSLDCLLEEGCFGHVPEVIDGDAPHAQRGCDAQAWGATEALRVWRWLDRQPGR